MEVGLVAVLHGPHQRLALLLWHEMGSDDVTVLFCGS